MEWREMKKYFIGYTQGVFDLFHVGHLNLLKQAKNQCDILIVGVNSDELVLSYKGKKPIINDTERRDIVSSIRYVDKAVIATTLDKTYALRKYKFDVLFIGDDWKGSERWKETETEMSRYGIDVVYLSRTKGISSSEIRDKLSRIDNI